MMMDTGLLDAEQMARFLRPTGVPSGSTPEERMEQAAHWVQNVLIPAFAQCAGTPLALTAPWEPIGHPGPVTGGPSAARVRRAVENVVANAARIYRSYGLTPRQAEALALGTVRERIAHDVAGRAFWKSAELLAADGTVRLPGPDPVALRQARLRRLFDEGVSA